MGGCKWIWRRFIKRGSDEMASGRFGHTMTNKPFVLNLVSMYAPVRNVRNSRKRLARRGSEGARTHDKENKQPKKLRGGVKYDGKADGRFE